jgi:ubiquinone/menaquinone biosynthesis C-methylase UbiE
MHHVVANHHAHHRAFAGVSGAAVGLTLAATGGPMARLAAELAGVERDDHVVDVGCGPGTAARRAARLGATVTAIDPARVMLRLARLLTRGDAITWLQGAAESLPVDDARATVLWSLSTVHHWEDVERGLAEAHRVLATGGRLVAIEHRSVPGATGLASHGWTDAQAEVFAAHCREAGFGDVTVSSHQLGRRGAVAVRGVAV